MHDYTNWPEYLYQRRARLELAAEWCRRTNHTFQYLTSIKNLLLSFEHHLAKLGLHKSKRLPNRPALEVLTTKQAKELLECYLRARLAEALHYAEAIPAETKDELLAKVWSASVSIDSLENIERRLSWQWEVKVGDYDPSIKARFFPQPAKARSLKHAL